MLEHKPIFSVIIPTFNRAHVIQRAVNSVLAQSFIDFELIVVDDGSKDGTENIVKQYNDDRIIYVKHPKNLGQNPALNTGLGKARGIYISFLDSDDEWLPEMLKRVYEKYCSDEQISCVYVLNGAINAEGNVVPGRKDYIEGYIYKEALEQGYITSPSTLSVKRSCFAEIGNFELENKVCQDDVMCLRLAKKYKFGLVREILCIIHTDAGNQLITNFKNKATDTLLLYERFKQDILSLCGTKTLAKHYNKCSTLFLLANDKRKAREIANCSLKNAFTLEAIVLKTSSFLPQFFFIYGRKVFYKLKTFI
jgi:glycosyltransferase involved in cell wall biosynthesis